MKQSHGATTPITGRAMQSRPVQLPPERQLASRTDFEAALYDAVAMLDLLATKLVDRDRDGDITYNPPPAITAIFLAALGTNQRLLAAFDRFDGEVREVQYQGLSDPASR